MKILLHTCCAPCSCYTTKRLKEENFNITLFWYNPNIHPYSEYQRRLNTLGYFANLKNLETIYNTEYDLEEFLKGQLNSKLRCEFCYRKRVKQTAKFAKEKEYNCFSTTLLYSIYQKHNLVKEIAEEVSKQYKIDFYYEDFRKGFEEGIKICKSLNIYRQRYCGCIFSEKERETS